MLNVRVRENFFTVVNLWALSDEPRKIACPPCLALSLNPAHDVSLNHDVSLSHDVSLNPAHDVNQAQAQAGTFS